MCSWFLTSVLGELAADSTCLMPCFSAAVSSKGPGTCSSAAAALLASALASDISAHVSKDSYITTGRKNYAEAGMEI